MHVCMCFLVLSNFITYASLFNHSPIEDQLLLCMQTPDVGNQIFNQSCYQLLYLVLLLQGEAESSDHCWILTGTTFDGETGTQPASSEWRMEDFTQPCKHYICREIRALPASSRWGWKIRSLLAH